MRKLPNPGPLGLYGFGLTTIALSAINAGLLPHEALAAVVPLAFAFGGIAQIIAGVLEFTVGNAFGTLAFTSYGLFWFWFSLLQWTVGAGWLKAPPPVAIAFILMLWGVFTFMLWIVTFRLSKATFSIFFLLWITFFLLAAADFGCGPIFAKLGGYFGLITGADAMLVGFIEVLNATANRTIIPLGEPFFS